jgi:tRNA(fMet)-specific endonuclease VapC
MYLLDTNAVIGLLAGNRELSRRIRERQTQDFGVPSIVAHELYVGAFKSKKQSRQSRLAPEIAYASRRVRP